MKQGTVLYKFRSWLEWSPWPNPWYRLALLSSATGAAMNLTVLPFEQRGNGFATMFAAIIGIGLAQNVMRSPHQKHADGLGLLAFSAMYTASFVVPASVIDALFTSKWHYAYIAAPLFFVICTPIVWIRFRSS